MKLYHGSAVPGIETLLPRVSSHGRPLVYLTDIETLALIYACNPLTPPDGYFPYYVTPDGELHYDEYYPGAFDDIFTGRSGYIYACEVSEELPRLDRMTWVYLSEAPVKVSSCEYVPDLRAALLKAEAARRLHIHRYETLSEKKLAGIQRMILREFTDPEKPVDPESEYARFCRARFPYVDELFWKDI